MTASILDTTPGPWLRDGETVYALKHHGWRKGEETFTNSMHFRVTGDNALADAQLAQKAPELAKALENLIQAIQYTPLGLGALLQISLARAVLAEAKETGT